MELDYAKIDKKRWVSCILLILVGTALSFTYLLSVFVNPLIAARGWDPGDIIFTFTLAMWVGTPSMMIGGKLVEKFRSRNVIIFCGFFYAAAIIISGFTTSVIMFMICQGVFASAFMFFATVAAMQNLGELFPERRGFIIGLYNGGMALGAVFQAPLAAWITMNYTVTTSIVVQGSIYGLITVICGLFIFNVPEGYKPAGCDPDAEQAVSKKASDEQGIDTDWKEMLKAPSFWMLLLALTLCNIAGAIFISNGAYVGEVLLGAAATTAAWMLSGINIGSGVGGLIYGWIADRIGSIYCLAVIGVLNCICAVIAGTIGVDIPVLFAVCAVILGANYGGLVTVQPVIAMNTYGAKHFGINYGLLGISAIVVSYIAPQLSVMENIASGITIAGIAALVGGIAAVLAKKMVSAFVKKYKKENTVQ